MAKFHHQYDHPADPWNTSTYQTGSTTPPKSHRGVIALLLVLVIVLCGIITLLGITNVKLFHALESQEHQELPISIYEPRSSMPLDTGISVMHVEENTSNSLGLDGHGVSQMYQLYYRLPQGLHVTRVKPGSSCEHSGVQPGDILTALNNIPITGPESLQACLDTFSPGDTVTLSIYRAGTELQVEIIIER